MRCLTISHAPKGLGNKGADDAKVADKHVVGSKATEFVADMNQDLAERIERIERRNKLLLVFLRLVLVVFVVMLYHDLKGAGQQKDVINSLLSR